MQIVEEPWFRDTSKKAKSENKNTSDGNAIPSSGEITITIESCNYPIHIIVSPKKV